MSKEKTNSRIKDEMQEMEETFKASVVVEDEPWQETACLPPPPPAPGADEASAGAGAPGWRGQVPIITEHLVTDDEPSDESLLCIEEPVVLVAEPYKNPDDTDAECTEDLDEGIEEPDEVGEEAREDSPPPPGGAGDAGGAAALPDLPWGGEAAPATKVDSWVAELVPTPGAIGGAIPRPRPRPPSPPPSPPARPARPAPPAPTGLHDDELDAERARIITEITPSIPDCIPLHGVPSRTTTTYSQSLGSKVPKKNANFSQTE
ncbi:wiskott-Aldrich syndrome protein homolog isoform X1 [Plutella xylostella]|uniref:wiskott-Aldrich syndrome protein homolog isoform X1 n=1 Tax=Plutella xylostella TaxID=51655 RepID=UPI0020330EF6|nr:wiskott-Aldrich syndrome protein homolog isoform X1 [Plutella xylostella]